MSEPETNPTMIPIVETRRQKERARGATMFAVLLLSSAVLLGCRPSRKAESATPAASANDGLPHTVAELNVWYAEPPAGQNAATFYLKAIEALQLSNVGGSEVPVLGKGQVPAPGQPVPAAMKSALTTLLQANRDALRWLGEGAKLERCRYPVDLTQGYDALFPHYKKLDRAATLLELSALVHAEANQPELAAQDVLLGLALTRSLADEPLILSQLVRSWTAGYAVAALEQTVNRTTLPAGAVAELAKTFQRAEASEARGDGFNRAMAGERAMSLFALSDPPQLLRGLAAPDLKMTAERRREITTRLNSGKALTAELDFFEAAFRRLMAARQEPFPARLKTDALGRQLVTEALDKKLFVLDLLLPSLGRRTGVEAECLAQLRLGGTAVALEQFRAAHDHRYPAALSELTPEYLSATPADPFDGQPLRYQKRREGYLLYSIGPDLLDDAGKRKQGKDGDLVFTVVTPARANH